MVSDRFILVWIWHKIKGFLRWLVSIDHCWLKLKVHDYERWPTDETSDVKGKCRDCGWKVYRVPLD